MENRKLFDIGVSVVKNWIPKFRLRFNLVSMLFVIGLVAVFSDVWTSSREHIIDANLKSHQANQDRDTPRWLVEFWLPAASSSKVAAKSQVANR